MSGSAADVLNVARSYLGTHEAPDGSNLTIIGEKFGWNGVAWCAEGVSVDELEAGVPFNKSASCSQLIARYESGENGTWLGKPDITEIQPADEGFLGVSGGDHTWLVESVDVANRLVHCIDDNWANQSMRVTRPYDSPAIFGFGRPHYDQAAAPDLPPPSATQGRPWLRLGSNGQAVIDLKAFLNAFDQATLDATNNVFDDATDAAVRKYQGDRGLEVDGVVGTQTYADMDRVVAFCAGLAARDNAEVIPDFPGTVQLGSVGDAAEAFQQKLRDRGWNIGNSGPNGNGVDRVFGPKCVAALEAYQGQKGLKVDGIGGPKSWVSLCTEPVTPD